MKLPTWARSWEEVQSINLRKLNSGTLVRIRGSDCTVVGIVADGQAGMIRVVRTSWGYWPFYFPVFDKKQVLSIPSLQAGKAISFNGHLFGRSFNWELKDIRLYIKS